MKKPTPEQIRKYLAANGFHMTARWTNGAEVWEHESYSDVSCAVPATDNYGLYRRDVRRCASAVVESRHGLYCTEVVAEMEATQ